MKRQAILCMALAWMLAGCTMGIARQKDELPIAVAGPTATESATARPQPSPTPTHPAAPTGTSGPTPTPTHAPAVWTPTDGPTALPATPILTPSRTPLPASMTRTATPTALPTLTPTFSPTPAANEAWWEVRTLMVGPGEPGRLYALQAKVAQMPLPAVAARLLFSDDYGQTWSLFPGGLPRCVHNVNLDYATPDALYASTCEGLYRWSGTGWALVSPKETFMVAVVYGRPNVIWATQSYAQDAAVIRSDDGGVTWAPAAAGLEQDRDIVHVGIDPRDPNTLYAIRAPKYAGSYLRRGTASGQWALMPTPNNNTVIDPNMSIDGATGDVYVVTALDNYQLWRSRNPSTPDLAAVEWERVHDFGPDVWASVLASGWGPNGLALYTNLTAIYQLGGGSIEVGPAVLHRSLDGGRTWSPLPIPSEDE